MAYNAKLNSYVSVIREEIADAVYNDRVGEWLDNSALEIQHKSGGARIFLAYGGPTVILDTSTGKLNGFWCGDKCFEYIGDNYAYDINEFLESHAY